MMYGLVAVALAGLAFAGVAIGFAVQAGNLKKTNAFLAFRLNTSEKERDETRTEFAADRARSKNQLEGLRNAITDMEDLLANCSDPELLRERFNLLLQRAAGGPSDSGSDELPGDGGEEASDEDSA